MRSPELALLTIFLCATVVLSAPTRIKLKGRSFQVERVRRVDYVAHGPAAMRKAYAKFSINATYLGATHFGLPSLDFKPVPSSSLGSKVGNTSEPEEQGAVSATPTNNNAEFVSPVNIGGQTIMMDFDTGSSDLWVFNTQLPAAEQQGHTIYDPTKSQTFKQLTGSTFSISYGDGSTAQGTVGTDTVDIGGATVQNQAVELATKVSGSFLQDTTSNGLVGLAFSQLNTVKPQPQQTFFDSIAGQLDVPVMTASLKSGAVGSYEFGTIDSTKFTGQMANISVNSSNGFWQFNSAQFAVGNGALQAIKQAPTAIADTGTSLMLVSPEVATAYYAQVPGSSNSVSAGGFVFPCNAQLPSLSIAVGDNNLATVPPAVLNFAPFQNSNGQMQCFGGVQSNGGNQFQIFGDVFLKSMFVVFDQRGPSLGLATPT